MNRIKIGLAVLACGFWAATSIYAGNTCTWTGSWNTLPANADDVIVVSSGGNLTWSNTFPWTVASWTQAKTYTGTATFTTVYGAAGFTNFTITGDSVMAGGTWMHLANTGAEVNRLCVQVGGNLWVSNATINANGRGYAGTSGPGKSLGRSSGASHGGAGYGSVFTNTYGSITAPTNLGSGGRYAATCGGGAIWLTVEGTTTVATAGMITANGLAENGCGAGGSIYLTTGWLTGTGTLQANGGKAVNGGGGGGGRVAIILTGEGSTFSTWDGTDAAFGGAAPYAGAAGTVFRKTADGETTLIIDNNNQAVIGFPMTTILNTDMGSFSNVVISQKGVFGVTSSTTLDFSTFLPTVGGADDSVITILDDANVTYPTNWTIQGYTLYAHGLNKQLVNVTIETNAVVDHYENTTAEIYKLELTVSGNLTVRGKIVADARGYSQGQGPGKGSSGSNGAGAAHGGTARHTDGSLNQSTYGSILAPTNFGSGAKSRGGGAIRLDVGGITTLEADSQISANAPQENSAGAGGSIYLTTGQLTGSGTIQANGGRGINGGGAGAGGRVAIGLTDEDSTFSTWSGTDSAYGGIGLPAAAGTVYRATTASSDDAKTVIVNNNNTATNATFTPLPAFTNSVEDLSDTAWSLESNGKVGLITNATILSMTLNTDSYLELAGHTLTTHFLTVTNGVQPVGTYTAAQLGTLVSDNSGGNGQVVVLGGPQGTVIMFR